MGSIRFRGVCDSDEYYALGWTKKKNIRIRNVARQPESNLVSGGSGNPISEEVDMEILRGLENLGAPWDCMGRFPVTKKQPGITETIGANMILDMWKPQYGSIRYHPDTECEH